MIPKVAFFHWDGPPMSWLRTVSIATFAKFNPDWEIRLIRNDARLRDFTMRVQQKADLSWWLALHEHGGFQVATDIVFFEPVPEAWLDADLCCCVNGQESGAVYQFAMLGCVPGHPFMREVSAAGLSMAQVQTEITAEDYQIYGTELLAKFTAYMGPHHELPMSALCHYNHIQCVKLWEREHELVLPPESIGVHFYGGHGSSMDNERRAGPNSDFPIVRLANAVFP